MPHSCLMGSLIQVLLWLYLSCKFNIKRKDAYLYHDTFQTFIQPFINNIR